MAAVQGVHCMLAEDVPVWKESLGFCTVSTTSSCSAVMRGDKLSLPRDVDGCGGVLTLDYMHGVL